MVPSEETFYKQVKELTAIYRPSASPGERRAAKLIEQKFSDAGLEPTVEHSRVVGSYWLPLGLLNLLTFLLSLRVLKRKNRCLAAAFGMTAAVAIWDDIIAHRRWLRRLLPKRSSYNVSAWSGDPDAKQTIVFMAHHDAANSGMIFSPQIPEAVITIVGDKAKDNKQGPPVMLPVVLAPALLSLAAIIGNHKLSKTVIGLSAMVTTALADVASRKAVPGANDNATGVAVLQSLAEYFSKHPLEKTRILFLSTGSEESLLEGMQQFSKRHLHKFDKENTLFFALDSVGSANLCVLAGEGMMQMYDYPIEAVKLVEGLAADLEIQMLSGLKHRNSTDALYPLKAGFQTVMLGSVNSYNLPANYHWPTDTAENVDYSSVKNAFSICVATALHLDRN